jgi:transcriptional regulator with XRE-family HTH domain
LEGQELAERHIALRERAGLTQEQEAKMAGVSPTTISGIESGKITRPHLKTLLKIARALGADVGELRESGKAEAPPSPTQPRFNGFEEERGAAWEAAVDDAHRLREGGRARLEELLAAWQASRERGEPRSARRGYLNEIEQLFNEAYDATHSLADILFTVDGLPAPENWEEVTAAERFYRTLIEVMRDAGFRVQESKGGPLKVEEPTAA